MKRILIVEDDGDLAHVLAERLKAVGVEIRAVSDGPAAIREIHRARPDVIILDLLLPVGGGLSVLKVVRSNAETKDIPVVVYTGIEDQEYRQYKDQVRALGVQAFVEKLKGDAERVIREVNWFLDAAPA